MLVGGKNVAVNVDSVEYFFLLATALTNRVFEIQRYFAPSQN